MLVSDIVRQVGRSFGDTDQTVILNTDIFDWINEAQLKICQKTECLTSTVTYEASTFPHVYPVDFIRTIRLLYGNVALDEIQIKDLDSKGIDLSIANQLPVFYYYSDSKFNLYPLQPSADTTDVLLGYIRTAAKVTLLGDTPEIPVIYHDELVKYALAKAHERNENGQGFATKMAEFTEGLHENMDDSFSKTNSYPVIRDDPWEDW